MMNWREVSVDDPGAHSLLTEYFAMRAEGFPLSLGTYRTVFPSTTDFNPPRGVFLLAEVSGAAVGCGGIRRIDESDTDVVFEVKHLYLQPHTRGHGYGRELLLELEKRARLMGAEQLVLDTNASLTAAGSLYRSTGFVEVPPYNDNSNATTWFRKVI